MVSREGLGAHLSTWLVHVLNGCFTDSHVAFFLSNTECKLHGGSGRDRIYLIYYHLLLYPSVWNSV